MITTTAQYWLSVSLLLIAVFELSFQRHGGVVSAVSELPASPLDVGDDVYKRRFMFGRRGAPDSAAVDDLWDARTVRQAASRRRFKFGKKSDPLAAEKRKLLMFGKKWSRDYPTEEDKRMFKFGKRN